MKPSNALNVGDVLFDRYCVTRLLGRGGMGAVWEAKHVVLGKTVAIKVPSEQATNGTARLKREALALAAIRHPNVLELVEWCEVHIGPKGQLVTFCLVTESLDGETLQQYLESSGPQPPHVVATWLSQVASGLGAIHDAGIVHRDIKGSNLFLCRTTGSERRVKVIDFGLARGTRLGDEGLTGPSGRLGTPQYMSPEQQDSPCAVDERSDLWSLAVVAYRAITGVFPFDCATDLTGTQRFSADFVAPSVHNSSVSPSLDRWFGKALSVQGGQRFQDAKEFIAAFLDAVSACGSSPPVTSFRSFESLGETPPGGTSRGVGSSASTLVSITSTQRAVSMSRARRFLTASPFRSHLAHAALGVVFVLAMAGVRQANSSASYEAPGFIDGPGSTLVYSRKGAVIAVTYGADGQQSERWVSGRRGSITHGNGPGTTILAVVPWRGNEWLGVSDVGLVDIDKESGDRRLVAANGVIECATPDNGSVRVQVSWAQNPPISKLGDSDKIAVALGDGDKDVRYLLEVTPQANSLTPRCDLVWSAIATTTPEKAHSSGTASVPGAQSAATPGAFVQSDTFTVPDGTRVRVTLLDSETLPRASTLPGSPQEPRPEASHMLYVDADGSFVKLEPHKSEAFETYY